MFDRSHTQHCIQRSAYTALACLLFLYSTSSAADSPEAETISSYYLDQAPIVLSATRLSQPQLEAPAAVTIIDRAMIKASGLKEIAELFLLVPGMQVAHANGHYPTATYHGLSDEYSRRMQVLIDGSSMYIPTVGGVLWSDLPLQIEDIERIEVIRGPNSASFGPNSFLGVISITTSHASQDNGLMVKATTGERGYRRFLVRQGGSNGDFDYRVNATYLEDDGFSSLHDSQRTNYLNGRLDYRATARDLLQMNFGFSEGPGEKGDNDYPDRNQQREAFYQNVRWEHHKNQDENFSLQFLYNYSETKDRFLADFGGGVTANIDDSQKAERFDLELQHTTKPTKSTRLIWGFGARHDRIRMPLWLDQTSPESNYMQRLFANLEWHILDNLILNSGVLYEENSIVEPAWSPRIALNYLFLPTQSLRLIASRSTRTPALAEKDLNVIIHTNFGDDQQFKSLTEPDTEEADYVEFGYHAIFIKRSLDIDIKAYRQNFHKLIGKKESAYLCDDGSILTTNTCSSGGDKFKPYGNLDSAVNQGYEIELNYRPSHRTLVHAGYSKTKIFSRDTEEKISESAPTDTLNFLVSQKLANNWQISSAFYYRSEMEWLLSGNPLGTYRRIDFTLSKEIKLTEKETLSLSFTLQTALDKNAEFTSLNTFDNRGFLEVEYQLK
jgi:iron complex outermembrane receptor protein